MPTTLADLERWEREGDIGKFHQILEYLDGEKYFPTRVYAIKVLGRLGNPDSIPYLIKEAISSKFSQTWIEEIVVNWGWRAVIPLLNYACNENNSTRRRNYAIRLISYLEKDVAFSTLLLILIHGYYPQTISKYLYEENLINDFLELVKSESPEVQFAALTVIDNSPVTPRSLELLMHATRDENAQVRCYAYSILRDCANQKDEERFEEISQDAVLESVKFAARAGLADEDQKVRVKSLQILFLLKDEGASDRIIDLIRDEDNEVRETAMLTLRLFPHHNTKFMLLRAYLDVNGNRKVRRAAVIGLATCMDEGCYELLLPIFLDEPDFEVAGLAAHGLLKFNPADALCVFMDTVLKQPNKWDRIAILRTWEHEVSPLLFGMLDSETDPQRVKALLWLLGALGTREDILPLCRKVSADGENLEIITYAVYFILENTEGRADKWLFSIDTRENPGFAQVKKLLLTRYAERGYTWVDHFLEELGVKKGEAPEKEDDDEEEEE